MSKQERNANDAIDARSGHDGRTTDRRRTRAARAWLAALLLGAGGSAVAASDLSVDLAGPATFVPGATSTTGAYTFTVANSGDTNTGTQVEIDFPSGSTITAWTCTAASGSNCGTGGASGTGDIDRSGVTVGEDSQVVYAITVQFGSSVNNSLTLSGTADASDDIPTYDELTITPTKQSRVSVSKTAALGTYVPQGSDVFTVTVENAGPSDAVSLRLVDTPASGMAITSWTCARSFAGACDVPSGSATLDTTFIIPADAVYTYTVNVAYAAGATGASLVNTATLTLPAGTTDPQEGADNDNTATATVTRNPRSDLAMTFTSTQPGSSYVPGTDDNPLRLTVRNNGSSTVTGAPLVVDLPAAVVRATSGWACTPATACSTPSGSNDVSTNLTLAAGAEVAIDFLLDYNSAATAATLVVPASIDVDSAPGADPANDPSDIRASHSRTIERRADIRVTALAPPTPTSTSPGAPFLYEFQVTNLGPSDTGNFAGEPGIRLAVDFDAGAAGEPGKCSQLGVGASVPCWEVCPASVAAENDVRTVDNCAAGTLASGSGDVGTPLRLTRGSSTTLRAYARSAQAFSGTLSTSAAVSLPTPTAPTPVIVDGTAANNTVSVQTVVQPSTNIEVVKEVTSPSGASAQAGAEITYTIRVRNIGIETANNLIVQDVFKLATAGDTLGFVPGTISWQCSASEGACCTHNGAANTCGTGTPTPAVSGNINTGVDLPSLGTVTFTARGQVHPDAASADASDTLDNIAFVTMPAGLADSDPSNNVSTVSTVVSNEPQLRLGKRLLRVSDTTPVELTYELLLENDGPGRASNVTVSDPLGHVNFNAAAATWTCRTETSTPATTACHAASGGAPVQPVVDIDAGSRVIVEVTVPTNAGAEGVVVNQASASGPGIDTVTSPTVESNLRATGDLAITKIELEGRTSAIPGTAVEYLITVTNSGDAKDDAFGARITDLLPPGLENASWTCDATTPVPGDLAFLAGEGGEFGGVAMVASSDGRHLYVAGSPRYDDHDDNAETPDVLLPARLMVHQRENVPGTRFGDIVELETEIQGMNDASDGGAAVNGMRFPVDIALSPDDTMVFVLSGPADGQLASLAMFNRVATVADASYGRLSFAGSLTIPGSDVRPARLVVSATNVYVSGTGDVQTTNPPATQQDVPHVLVFRRSASTGMPTFDVGVTSGVPASPGAMALSVADAALFVASADASTSHVARYRIEPAANPAPAGRLTWQASSEVGGHAGISDFAFAGAQRHLYALAAGSGNLARFNTAGTGVVQSIAQAPAAFGAGANLFSGTARIALSPDGEHLLVANAGTSPATTSALVSLRRNASGGLSADDAILDASSVDDASDVLVTSDGRHVLVATSRSGTGERQVAVFTRRAPDPVFGFLELERDGVDGVTGLDAPSDVAVAPPPVNNNFDGHHVYAVSLAEGAISVYRRDTSAESTSGTHLVHLQTIAHGAPGVQGLERARRVHVSPDGELVFVSSEDEDTVAVFQRNADGTLAWRQVLRDGVGGVDGLLGAHGMVMDANADYLYVAGGFEHAVAQFSRNDDGIADGDNHDGHTFTYLGVVKNGSGGATGMLGMRDLVVTEDNEHVLGVGTGSNAVVTLRRTRTGANEGRLTFAQARPTSGVYLSALATRQGDATDTQHIYAVGRDDDSLIVLRRISDPTSSAFGSLSTLFEYRGLPGMDGPNDVVVSDDGRRVYVTAQYSDSVLVFDRDLNRNSVNYGSLVLVETRRDGVDGVDGLRSPYALAASSDSRNVYVAGFDDRAIAAFAVGSGSYCSAAGGGDIDDTVNIGAGGTVEYRIKAFIRADATDVISNEACVVPPERFDDIDASNNCDTVTLDLTPRGDLSVDKTNGRPSSVAGEQVRYTVRVDNPGPSNLTNDPDNGRPLTVTDLLDNNAGLVPGSATWTCEASGSGTLDFVDVFSADNGTPDAGDDTPLAGITDLAVVPSSSPGAPGMLVAVSVLDNSVVLFERDLGDGRLVRRAVAQQGAALLPGGGAPLDSLSGARAVVASADGRFVYVASRVSDAISVFEIQNAGTPSAQLRLVEVQRSRVGLDQASHLILSPDPTGRFLYVAGSNDDAIAVFSRNDTTGALTHVQSVQNGAPQGGGSVAGLDGVDFLVTDPDGEHLYALAGSAGTLAILDRDSGTGMLAWRSVFVGAPAGSGLKGAASAVFDGDGETLYVAAADGNRIVVLDRQANGALPDFGGLQFHSRVQQGVGSSLGLVSPRKLVLTGDDRHLYVTAQGGSSVAWYGRDENDGSLRYLGQRSSDSADVLGLSGATGMAFDDASNQLYVAGTLDASIAQFERKADSWCPASGSGDIDAVPVNIAAGGSVVFTIDATVSSTLTGNLVNVAYVTSGSCEHDEGDPLPATCVDTVPGNDSSEDDDSPSLQADLWITKTDGLAAFDGLAGATAVVGTDRHVYVAGATDNAIGIFEREDDAGAADLGALTFLRSFVAGEGGALGLNAVADLALSPDGDHLYAVSPTENSVAAFARDDATGQLAYLEQQRQGVLNVTGMNGARAVALSADGRHVYVAGQFANAVAAFARNVDSASADYGKLTFLGSVQHGVGGADGLLQPVSLAVAPDGAHVYALSATGTSLAVLLRNPNAGSAGFGQLSFLRRLQGNVGGGSGLESGRSLAIDGTGTHLYVLGSAPGTLAHFRRTPANGELVLDGLLTEGDPGVSGLAGAERLRLSADGMLHVAATAADAVLTFTIDGNGRPVFGERVGNGDAAPGGGDVLGLDGVRDVFATADAASLYAVSGTDAAISGFDRAGTTLGYRETFFDGLGGVAPGSSVRYTIVVGNAGPAAVEGARVVDIFPSDFVSASWICDRSISTGSCPESGNGNLDVQVDLPAGTEVVFEATGVLGDSVSGVLSNTATVSSSDVADFDVSNNSATDADTVLSPALDLRAEIVDVLGDALPGDRIDYLLEFTNAGPTYATGATLSDVLPDAVFDAAWSCSALPVAGVLTARDSDAAGTGLMVTAVAPSAFGQYVYATAATDTPDVRPPLQASRVLVYARDPIDGTLVLRQTLVQGADGVGGIDGAADIALSSDERFVYVAGHESDAIAVFERDASDGTLTYLRRYEDGLLGIEGLGGVVRLLLAPGGTHLYAAGNIDDAIAVFTINATTGELAQAGQLRQGTGGIDGLNGVVDLAWSRDATHLLAIADDNASIAAFARNAGTGLLTAAALRQEFQANDGALLDPVAITAHDNRVWVASGDNGRVSAYDFDATTATFSADAVAVLDGLQDPADLLFDPDQARLHVALRGSGHVAVYNLLRDDAEEIDRRAVPLAQALAFAPGLKQLHAGGAALHTFSRERGSRCPLEGTGALGTQTVDIAPGGSLSVAIGGSLYANAIGTLRYDVSVQPRDAAAELEPADNTTFDSRPLLPAPTLSATKTDGLATVVAGETLRYTIGVSNAGVSDAVGARVLDDAPIFPASNAGLVSGGNTWSCAVNAPLVLGQSIDAATTPAVQGIGRSAVSPDGRRVYAVSAARDALLVFPRAVDGTLGAPQDIANGSTLGTTVTGLDAPSAVAVSDDGRFVYVTAVDSNSLAVFTYDADSDSHAFSQALVSGSAGVIGMTAPRDVVAGVDGDHVYVAGTGSDSIVMFRRNPATGLLVFAERVRDGFGTITPDTEVIRGVRRLVRSADGNDLYAVGNTSQSVASFAITPDTGALRYLGVLRAGTVPGLAGVRDLVSTPGDRHFYALGAGSIVRLDRTPGEVLAVGATTAGVAGLDQPRALAVDDTGARLYLADAVGGVSVLARDWSSGALAWRYRLAQATVPAAGDAALLGVGNEVLLGLAGPGLLQRLDERALSYCHVDGDVTDGIDTTLDLAVDGTAEFLLDATVHPSARGTLQNVVRIDPMAGSAPSAVAGEASDDTEILVVSDLSVTKTGPSDAVAGLPIRYEVRVTNAGPSDALGARVVDALHPALEDATWTCAANGTSSCPATGSGALDVPVTLHVGDELVFTIDATIDSAFVGDLVNAVSLTPEPGATDPTGDDTSDDVSTVVTAEVDLSIAKSDGVDRIVAGTATTYVLAVSNAGPSDAPDARLVDLLPPQLRLATWTCTVTGGAVCQDSGRGSVDMSVSLPAGSSIEVLIEATVADTARGEVRNDASITVQGDPTELDESDNAASDTNAIDVVTDIRLELRDGYDPYDPASSIALPYEIEVHNAGPSSAGETALSVTLPGNVTTAVPEGCTRAGTLLTCTIESMFGGERVVFPLALRGLPAAPGTYTVTGNASAPEPDPDTANNSATQDTILRTGADVAVSITRMRHVTVGDATRYQIDVVNVGSVAAEDVTIEALVANGLIDATWTCSGGCTASGVGDIVDTVDIAGGQRLRYELRATVDPAIPSNVEMLIEQAVDAYVPGDIDINTDNNHAVDIALALHGIFSDGFEVPVIKRVMQQENAE